MKLMKCQNILYIKKINKNLQKILKININDYMVNYYPNENNNLSQNIEEEANLLTNNNKCIKK